MLQTHVNDLAERYSQDRVKQARSYLKSIFDEAIEQEFLVEGPDPEAEDSQESSAQGQADSELGTTWMVLANTARRDRLLLMLDMTEALRPSELFALRWRSFDDRNTLEITETVYRRKLRPFGKTPKSLSKVHLPDGLANELRLWKLECKKASTQEASPDAFMFPNADGGFMDTANYRFRVLKPLAEEAGYPEAELPDPAPDDGDTGAEHGVGEGHPGAPAALAARHDGQRVHAGAAGERAADGRIGLSNADERRRG